MFTSDLRLRAAVSLLSLLSWASPGQAAQSTPQLGQAVSEEQLQGLDLIVMPNGNGLPEGSGTAVQGQVLYEQQCESCHGAQGEGSPGVPALAGGSTTATPPLMTVGSYWPYATTVYDYIRRAMPPTAPKSLSDDEVYQVVAYVLQLNGLITENFELNRNSLPAVVMPNRNGFIDRSQVQQVRP